ncbi:winged helix-turn-helix transcriptional regulator [Microbacterium terricola]|nr:winged helix-turn-helix transcriptional regulator [Microbacterium terricola]UYK40796.1 winged helix-turn-helix transcriptional regulator [Microbacterium terricola]
MTRPAYSALSSYSRVQILRQLQARPRRTVPELCKATGLHANTVREHVQRLIDGGYVIAETEHRTTRGRPRVLYSAATGSAAASSPIARRKAADAARRGDLMRRVMPWTDAHLPADAAHQLDALVDDLAGAGFDPVVDEAGLTIDLSPCPHAEADGSHRAVLCAVHVGLMEGVLAEAGGPLHVAELRTTCDPSQCSVRLQE